MDRFYSIFLTVVASCSFSFAASTNIVGGGSIDLSGFQFSGSGESPTNYAANIENIIDLQASGATFEGGAGGTLTTNSSFDEIVSDGGVGLKFAETGLVMLTNSVLNGGNGGSVSATISADVRASGGYGIDAFGPFELLLKDGVTVEGGNGGSASTASGGARSYGGDAIHAEVDEINSINSGDVVISNGTYQGGSGGSVTFNSTDISTTAASILRVDANGARGGHGLYFFDPEMFRVASRSLNINGGTFSGGAGGSAVNSTNGTVIADGGSGIYVGSVLDLVISGGIFIGGKAGMTNGVAAQDGYGATIWDSNVEISDGDFQGVGTAAGLLFGSVYYPSSLSVSGGQFNGVRVISLETPDFGPPFIGATDVTISGGDLGDLMFSGNAGHNVSITGGTITDFLFVGSGEKSLSLGTNVLTSGNLYQDGGTVNFAAWSDPHFKNTMIFDGTMNFNGQSFNLLGGSSFSLLDPGAEVNFNDGFTAESGSQITTTFDGTNQSTIVGSDLVFEAGARWTVNGVSSIATGTEITLASATSTLTNNLIGADVDYIGGSWALGLTVSTVGNDLIGTSGFVPLQEGLELEPGTDFHMAMEQLTIETDFVNSSDEQFEALKAVSVEAAGSILQEQFVNNPMVGVLIQLQGTFSDQIADRTRSHLRYKNWGNPTRSPQGAQGPEAWNNSLDALNASLPSWDARESLKSADSNASSWTHDAAPRSSDGKITIPATYQVWGRGYGSYFKQADTGDLVGYDATIGGGVLGLDKRFNNLLLGLGGGYANTKLNGNAGGEDKADTFYGTAYASVVGERGFLDFNLNYAYNDVETEGSTISGNYVSDYDANTFSMYLGGGMGFSTFNGSVLFTPEASLLTTYYTRGSYTETALSTDPWPDLVWDSYDQWSYLSSLGATLSTIQQFESFNLEMEFQPEIRAHWLHEFNTDMDNDSYTLGGQVTPIGVSVRAREEDLVKVGAGVRFSKWGSDTLEFGLDLDGVFGSDYEAYVLSGKLLHRF